VRGSRESAKGSTASPEEVREAEEVVRGMPEAEWEEPVRVIGVSERL
jgi:hypothetical protein